MGLKIDTKEAARRTGLSEGTLANWRFLGCGPSFLKFGRKVMYDADQLEQWMAGCSRTSTAGSPQGPRGVAA